MSNSSFRFSSNQLLVVNLRLAINKIDAVASNGNPNKKFLKKIANMSPTSKEVRSEENIEPRAQLSNSINNKKLIILTIKKKIAKIFFAGFRRNKFNRGDDSIGDDSMSKPPARKAIAVGARNATRKKKERLKPAKSPAAVES